MVKITVYKDKNKEFKGFHCTGHAGYARHGEDIVCAGISTLLLNTVNSIDALTNQKFRLDSDENSGLLHLEFLDSPQRDVVLLMDSMILGLEGILSNYGKKYVTLNYEEV